MTLSNNEILQYMSGYLRYEEIDGYLSFSRFTKKQEDFLKGIWTPKEKATSSMFLEFVSDCTEISFEYRITPGSSQNFYGIDLLVNGMNTVCKFEQTDFSENTFTAKFEEQGKKKITVYFPNLAKMEIKNLTVDGTVEKAERKLKYLALGDSITQGYCTKHPSLTYVNIITEKFNTVTVNQAIGGDIFRKENLDENMDLCPDFITVAYGTNDWKRGMELYTHTFEYFKKLREIYANMPIFALLPIYRNTQEYPTVNNLTLEDARKIYGKAAEENGITVINAKNFIPHHEDFFCDKVLHPSETGFIYYGHNLYEALKEKLNENN